MTHPRKPLWTEGTFLRQHHLQQLDAYHERSLAACASALRPHGWGVLTLDVDEQALAAGTVNLRRFEARMPSGALVAAGADFDDILPPRPLEGFSSSVRSLDVHVGIAHSVKGRPSVDLSDDAASVARYARFEARVLDENAGADERPVDFLRHNLRILYGHERRELFDSVRIGQVVRSPSGVPVLRRDCVPPVTRVAASPFLSDGLRGIVNALATRQHELAGARRWRGSTLDVSAGTMGKFVLLQAINAHLPRLAHVSASPHVSPEDAYLALADLVGALCTFSPKRHPGEVPPFDHLDLGGTFSPLFALARELIAESAADKYVAIPLQRDDSMFTARLLFERLLAHEYYLVARGGLPDAALRSELPKHTKIASWAQMEALVKSAVRGAPLAFDFSPPGVLPLTSGAVVFRIDKGSDHFKRVVDEGTLAIYQPLESARVELALFAVDSAELS
jgi:type VI secretion system protein ImpJ